MRQCMYVTPEASTKVCVLVVGWKSYSAILNKLSVDLLVQLSTCLFVCCDIFYWCYEWTLSLVSLVEPNSALDFEEFGLCRWSCLDGTAFVAMRSGCYISGPCFVLTYMNSMKLVILLHFISCKKGYKQCCATTTPESIHTKVESKRGSAFAFIFGVNWPVQWM